MREGHKAIMQLSFIFCIVAIIILPITFYLEMKIAEQELMQHQLDQQIQRIRTENAELIDELERLKQQQQELDEIFSTLETFTATAYTHVATPGIADINGTGDGLTATGMQVREGIVAVDPTVIPLGTELYIEGYGKAVAGDTGGAIKGKRIDVFLESRSDAYRWGVREVKIVRL